MTITAPMRASDAVTGKGPMAIQKNDAEQKQHPEDAAIVLLNAVFGAGMHLIASNAPNAIPTRGTASGRIRRSGCDG